MNNTDIKKNSKILNTDKKKVYLAPSLKYFGSISALTTGGSTGPAEQGQSTNPVRMTSSDRDLKENIVKVGDHFLGIGLYLFDYKPEFRDICGDDRQFGVMADEVEKIMPEAVAVHSDGYKMVNYKMLGINRNLH